MSTTDTIIQDWADNEFKTWLQNDDNIEAAAAIIKVGKDNGDIFEGFRRAIGWAVLDCCGHPSRGPDSEASN